MKHNLSDMKKLYLCLALMSLVLYVVLHSSSLVTMAVPMPVGRDVGSPQSSEGQPSVDLSSRFPFPPDIWAVRKAGPKWNHAKLHGSLQLCDSSSWRKMKRNKGI